MQNQITHSDRYKEHNDSDDSMSYDSSGEEEMNSEGLPYTQKKTSFLVEDILGIRKKELKDNGHEKSRTSSSVPTSKMCPVRQRSKHTSISPSKFRQCFDPDQVKQLERIFQDTVGYPDTHMRRKIAKSMEVSETKIQIWFQNRRAKFRRQRRLQNRKNSYSYAHNYLLPTTSHVGYTLMRDWTYLHHMTGAPLRTPLTTCQNEPLILSRS